MRARRKHLIDEVMKQHDRIHGPSEAKHKAFKKHLEQFFDHEIEEELKILKQEAEA